MELLKAENLVKEYPGVTAVAGASFGIESGEILGFLGPNGAGKTTTINMLTGLARITSGAIFLQGKEYTHNPKAAQRSMGIVPDESNLYDDLDGFQNLCFCAALYGMKKEEREEKASRLIKRFDLQNAGKRPFKAYSRGMKRKLTIAAGIIHNPQILFLDEPTTGIDVVSAGQIRRLIQDLNETGTSIFLTTHYIEEAERLCHRVAFIVDGRIVRIGSLEELMREAQREHVLQITATACDETTLKSMRERFPECRVELRNQKNGRDNRQSDTATLTVVSQSSIDLMPIVEFLHARGSSVSEAKLVRPSLEEVFVQVTGIDTHIMRIDREGKKK